MNQSFYIGALGAINQQANLNVISNNVANADTVGFKAQYSAFSDLVYAKGRSPEGEDAVKSGSGTKIDHVKTLLDSVPYEKTGLSNDYAIDGEGFFMLKNPVTGDISYSRDGRFQKSLLGDKYYLVNIDGNRVLNMDGEEITYDVKAATYPGSEDEEDEEDVEELEEGEHNPQTIGVYTFNRLDGIRSKGNNEFAVTEKNGEPILLENAKVVSGALEASNTDYAKDITHMMEAQRAYSYALKMVQTSDEVEQTINSLR